MSSERKNRKLFMFNDPIHGHIELHPLLVKIIDTPEFQRLRYIKQLGGAYYVYPGGSHNRFEHSIGVSYLAGKMMETLRKKKLPSNVTIEDEDVLCVQIAGLCHDLGHGPFSHLFDQFFIPKVCPGKKWSHEEASVDMFRHMLDENNLENQLVRDEFKRWNLSIEKHRKIIENLIMGKPDEDHPERGFMYEIVNNEQNGIDVDKWDYFARDSHSLGIPSNFDMGRTMHLIRVMECKNEKHDCLPGATHICMRDNEGYNLYEMFHTRYSLHKRAYQHEVVKGVELMITDALVAANDHLKFCGKKMSEAIDNMDAYIQLTDDVFQQILHSADEKMETARGILKRLQSRKLYKCIIDKPWKKAPVPKEKDICDGILAMATSEMDLSSDDIHVLVVTLSYGMKTKNPMLYYTSEDQDETVRLPRDKVSPLSPETPREYHIRVYVKKSRHKENAKVAACRTLTVYCKRSKLDAEKVRTRLHSTSASIVYDLYFYSCFEKWWNNQPKELTGSSEENGASQP